MPWSLGGLRHNRCCGENHVGLVARPTARISPLVAPRSGGRPEQAEPPLRVPRHGRRATGAAGLADNREAARSHGALGVFRVRAALRAPGGAFRSPAAPRVPSGAARRAGTLGACGPDASTWFHAPRRHLTRCCSGRACVAPVDKSRPRLNVGRGMARPLGSSRRPPLNTKPLCGGRGDLMGIDIVAVRSDLGWWFLITVVVVVVYCCAVWWLRWRVGRRVFWFGPVLGSLLLAAVGIGQVAGPSSDSVGAVVLFGTMFFLPAFGLATGILSRRPPSPPRALPTALTLVSAVAGWFAGLLAALLVLLFFVLPS